MLYLSYVPRLEYHYTFCFASVQVYIQSGKYIKYNIFMFQLLEILSRSILIEILNNTIQQESGIHGVTEKKNRMTCYSLTKHLLL